MGRRGPAPQSAAELKLRGSFRADRHADREHMPKTEGRPKKPRTLKDAALAHWQAVVPGLVKAGLVGELDTPALVAMCKTWARYLAADEALDANPLDKNAAIRRGAYLASWTTLASKFGLTPSDRARLRVHPTPEDEEDDFEDFLSGKKRSG